MLKEKPDLRIFLDANVLFSAAYQDRAGLAALWEMQSVLLITSRYAAQEAANNLSRVDQLSRLEHLLARVTVLQRDPEMNAALGIDLPDKDRPILAAAVEAKADFLLTGDGRHFGAYFNRTIRGVRIVRPGEFLRLARNQ